MAVASIKDNNDSDTIIVLTEIFDAEFKKISEFEYSWSNNE